MHLLIKNIDWDYEGQPPESCLLPNTVLAINAPNEWDTPAYREAVAISVTEVYGFLHHGCEIVAQNVDRIDEHGGFRQAFDWKTVDAVMEAPEEDKLKEGNKVKALLGKRQGQIGTVVQVGQHAVWVDFGSRSINTFKLDQVEKVNE